MADTGIATSVIIGRNGIGKSYLLRAIAEIFRTLDIIINKPEEGLFPELKYHFAEGQRVRVQVIEPSVPPYRNGTYSKKTIRFWSLSRYIARSKQTADF